MTPKRAFDLISSALGLAVLSPLFAVIAGTILLDDRGPVFFRQERVGLGGRRFRILKFRTMRPDAERVGLPITAGADPRITRIGRVLRKAKLDELPQLFNVLRGEMSLVGPRPEVPRYVELYSHEQREVLSVVPGITDPASTAYIDEAAMLEGVDDPERVYIEQIMPAKLRLNLEYARRATFRGDIALILRTFRLMLVPARGAANGVTDPASPH
jgi:lipopolysaccharide/colanic/teichoic acid biosynthesis glycosyltransferase